MVILLGCSTSSDCQKDELRIPAVCGFLVPTVRHNEKPVPTTIRPGDAPQTVRGSNLHKTGHQDRLLSCPNRRMGSEPINSSDSGWPIGLWRYGLPLDKVNCDLSVPGRWLPPPLCQRICWVLPRCHTHEVNQWETSRTSHTESVANATAIQSRLQGQEVHIRRFGSRLSPIKHHFRCDQYRIRLPFSNQWLANTKLDSCCTGATMILKLLMTVLLGVREDHTTTNRAAEMNRKNTWQKAQKCTQSSTKALNQRRMDSTSRTCLSEAQAVLHLSTDHLAFLLRRFLIPITSVTFIELSTAAYLRTSFFPHHIQKLHLLTLFKSGPISSLPRIEISPLRRKNTLSGNKSCSDNSLAGNNPEDRYRWMW